MALLGVWWSYPGKELLAILISTPMLMRIYQRPKRLECAVAVQRARLMDANPWTGPPDRGIFRVLGAHANLRQRQIVDGT